MIQQEFIDQMTTKQLRQKPKYGIYINGKPLYIGNVNIYNHKGTAKNELKKYTRRIKYDRITLARVDESLSKEDFEDLFTQGVLEIREII